MAKQEYQHRGIPLKQLYGVGSINSLLVSLGAGVPCPRGSHCELRGDRGDLYLYNGLAVEADEPLTRQHL